MVGRFYLGLIAAQVILYFTIAGVMLAHDFIEARHSLRSCANHPRCPSCSTLDVEESFGLFWCRNEYCATVFEADQAVTYTAFRLAVKRLLGQVKV